MHKLMASIYLFIRSLIRGEGEYGCVTDLNVSTKILFET